MGSTERREVLIHAEAVLVRCLCGWGDGRQMVFWIMSKTRFAFINQYGNRA